MAQRNVTTTATSAPWKPQRRYLKDYMGEAQDAFTSGDFGQVAPLSNYTQQGVNMMAQRARQGAPEIEAARDYTTGFLSGDMAPQGYGAQDFAESPERAYGYGLRRAASGDYLNSNPYFDEAVSQALDPVQSRVNSQFAGSGRYGSGMHSSTMTEQLGDVSSRMSYQNYADERARQQAAQQALMGRDQNALQRQFAAQQALMGRDARYRDDMRQTARTAPSMAQARYQDPAQLMQVGDVLRQQEQRELQAPYQELQQYGGLISGDYGGTQTQTKPYFRDETANTIGNISGAISAGVKGLDFISGVTDLFS
jgi:hypothetical protein